MKYSAWIDYPSFSIAIIQSSKQIASRKFVDNSIVRGTEKHYSSIDELKHFLFSLPNPPKEQIESALISLRKIPA